MVEGIFVDGVPMEQVKREQRMEAIGSEARDELRSTVMELHKMAPKPFLWRGVRLRGRAGKVKTVATNIVTRMNRRALGQMTDIEAILVYGSNRTDKPIDIGRMAVTLGRNLASCRIAFRRLVAKVPEVVTQHPGGSILWAPFDKEEMWARYRAAKGPKTGVREIDTRTPKTAVTGSKKRGRQVVEETVERLVNGVLRPIRVVISGNVDITIRIK